MYYILKQRFSPLPWLVHPSDKSTTSILSILKSRCIKIDRVFGDIDREKEMPHLDS